jgi:signal transduction histidine kinase
VSAEREGFRFRVRVADNGPGLPDDQKRTVFEKDVRGLDSGGTGIGLFLVRELVTRFGGSVHAVDNEPRGAVFVVDLPVAI